LLFQDTTHCDQPLRDIPSSSSITRHGRGMNAWRKRAKLAKQQTNLVTLRTGDIGRSQFRAEHGLFGDKLCDGGSELGYDIAQSRWDVSVLTRCLGREEEVLLFPTETGYLDAARRMQIVRDVWGKSVYVRFDIGWLAQRGLEGERMGLSFVTPFILVWRLCNCGMGI
jgi:hypothetical protein